MASDKFRQELRSESQQWQQDGLITSEQSQQLIDRYQLDRLDQQASSRFTFSLIVVGAILIGLGIITYVAANWQDIPKVFRTLLLFGLFAVTNLSGFWLYRRSDKLQQILGQGLLLIGGMTLGATMALMAQMYHISGPLHPLLITWSIGIALMAYCVKNAPLGILSALILGWASAIGWGEANIFMRGNSLATTPTVYSVILFNIPTIAGMLYFPLAHWCRSRGLFVISTLVALFSCIPLWIEVRYQSNNSFAASLLGFGLLTLPIAFLWSYPLVGSHKIGPKLQTIARNISMVSLGFLLYIGGFRYSFLIPPGNVYGNTSPTFPGAWMYLVPGIVVLALVTAKQWIQLFRSSRSRSLNIVTLAMLSIVGGYSILGRTTDRPEMLFVLNAMLVVLSIGCIRESLETKRRSQFWYGLLVLVVLIASRFLEYDTELILKAAILTLCGFGIIAAGIWFEKYAGRTRATLPSDSSGDLNP
jgi:uncharacterized membrane protein